MAEQKTLKRQSRRVKIDPRVAARSWLMKDDAVKTIGAQKEEERVLLLQILQEQGVKDSDGHYWIRWPDDPVEGRLKGIKAEKHVTKRLNIEAAEEYLRKRKLYDRCTETVVSLDEGKILALNALPDPKTKKLLISDEDLATLYDVTEAFHFVPQRIKL